MKILAIDFGQKNIGLAVSNQNETIAFPHSVLTNDRQLLRNLEKIVSTEGVEKIVLGESLYKKNTKNNEQLIQFKQELTQRLNLPIDCEDELLTSEAIRAIKPQTKKHRHDLAAMLILEAYLKRKHN
ncbi:MAG: hypothetical protein A2445_04110 [Candidatus Jacksonbacteria bacterium RIFOXYC2_FULL_44_29]|nr:MAG: hypothetical protein UV19_C0001G0033 [Parcubacteria group bacterium GW2011_GWA2_42_28]KKT56228.1 MAG: hypothetical protein UW45_C0001G0032 [Parcubacteria group bacterium GW2011_GWC2_44_22]OGY76124.1 MAG: hypothetical protein A2240_00330 [Candidatus Jacksonbacteria bacterium RIFOXYA2_FULL_43_12]OGY77715.1 MAG: hypothetical protein A2295_02830 [Candidatus Jacksonbacteria bacterium RIFOXYB2_FULL_44_15]OGY78851.1 MAG: hypothetical protein A2550_04895 [Candidatus Jacksonbacteria bacterium RI